MAEDEMGSKYPAVDTSICIECGACVKVCPFINPASSGRPLQCFAAINLNENVRLNSSSGGVFKALAQEILSRGGIVVGAVFNKDWEVEHIASENMVGVERMMGSKYVQSDTMDTFAQTRKHLVSGRTVLYTGTPCQIAGLKHFLRRDYETLITVEVICHGAPERGVWRNYLREILTLPSVERRENKSGFQFPIKEPDVVIDDIAFRDKRSGWKKYSFALLLTSACKGYKIRFLPSIYQPFKENTFMKAFLSNWSLRPSCYVCQAKNGRSLADLTLGDFWGIERTDIMPDDDKGISAIVSRSEKGLHLLQQCEDLCLVECSYQDIFNSNPSIEKSVNLSGDARYFHKIFPKRGFTRTFNSIYRPSFFRRVRFSMKYRLSALLRIKS